MLRQNNSNKYQIDVDVSLKNSLANITEDVDLADELGRLEAMILDSPHLPFTGLAMVEEKEIVAQIELVRANLPETLEKARQVVQRQQELLEIAENRARQIVEAAQQMVAKMLDENEIVREAEKEAENIWDKLQQDCETIKEKTLLEVEEMRTRASQEVRELRQSILSESQEIQRGADLYADGVLSQLEQQVTSILETIRQGREQLNT
jgi:hypothetical protein